MRYGKFLSPGGTIGVTAPSYGAGSEPYRSMFRSAAEFFRSEGYALRIGTTVRKHDGIGISTDPETCGRELTRFYCSLKNDLLISAGGGELMCETIDHVDWERVRKAAPKWFLGYSDNTNFTFLLPTLCDVAAIYGPCIGAFGRRPMDQPVRDVLSLITGKTLYVRSYDKWEKDDLRTPEDPCAPYHYTEPSEILAFNWNGLPVRGRFLGGCLDILNNIAGTDYDRVREFNERYKEDGTVWFLESCDLSLYDIRRTMWHLRHAGWFDTAKAFLIGRPLIMGDVSPEGLNQYNAVLDVIEDLGVPVLMDLDIGHIAPQMPVLCGAVGTVFRHHDQVEIGFELV